MSQFYCNKPDGTEVLYGLDHVLGWFYTEFAADNPLKTLVDLCSTLGTLSRGELVGLLKATDAPQQHITFIALDIDPAGTGEI